MKTFDDLCDVLDDVNIVNERNPEAYAVCPFCGKPPRDDRGRLARHFHFGNLSGEEFGKCFVCGQGGGYDYLYKLATGEEVEYIPTVERQQKPAEVEPPFWQTHAVELVKSYMLHPKLAQLWQSYKPIKPAMLIRYRFGVGILPYELAHGRTGALYRVMPIRTPRGYESLVTSVETGAQRKLDEGGLIDLYRQLTGWDGLPVQHQERLIVPLYENGVLVGLRGRSLSRTEKRYKWMSAVDGDSPIFGLEHVTRGDVVVLGENYVDAAMVSELRSDVNPLIGVALGTARTIRPDEVERLKAKQPELVIVMLDNDLAGQATGEVREQLRQEYIEKYDREPAMPLHGLQCLDALRKAGVNAQGFPWNTYGAPPRAGVDWALIHGWI